MASGQALALGRVVGSLCVLTAKDGDAESGMLASWVSQVSAAHRCRWKRQAISTFLALLLSDCSYFYSSL